MMLPIHFDRPVLIEDSRSRVCNGRLEPVAGNCGRRNDGRGASTRVDLHFAL